MPTPRDEGRHLRLFSLEDGLDASVRHVPDPPADTTAPSFVGAARAEEHPLDAARHDDPNAHRHGGDTRDVIRYGDRTALVVVDVQNDFTDPSGSLAVRGGEEVLGPINREIVAARGAGALVVYTQDWHPEHTPHFRPDGGVWPVHCVGGTWGAELHPDLEVVGGETIRKGVDGRDGYSAFSVRDPESGRTEPTRLERILRDRAIERVVLAGLATDYCVVETVLDARRLGFAAEVVADAIRAVDLEPGDGDRAIERMREAGAVIA